MHDSKSNEGLPGGADDFCGMIVEADRQHRSWRKKLEWISDLLEDSSCDITEEKLAYLAVYLRFVGTGQVRTAEDGGHYRPSHHARIARRIYERLSKIKNPANIFIIRKIYPWLPSFDAPFMRAEPLTRIRDIAHRNDIPRELKDEIKHTLQNKLHRSAGPEDLDTSSALLEKITAPGVSYPEAFAQEFRKFHEELKEFFHARSLDEQLRAIAQRQDADLIRKFLEAKGDASSSEQAIAVFSLLTELRSRFSAAVFNHSGAVAQELQIADILLEDYSFSLTSGLINNLTADRGETDWSSALICLHLMTANLRLSGFVKEECSAIENELQTWSADFDVSHRLKLLRLKATLNRLSRLVEGYAYRILHIFPARAERLGRALGVSEHAIRFFSESDIRAHPVFQLSKLLSALLKHIRVLAALSVWDIIVPGKAAGHLIEAHNLSALPAPERPVIALLERVEGDEEIPSQVIAIVTATEMPHLSHLAVRARQREVAFAVCEDGDVLKELRTLAGKPVFIDLAGDKVSFGEYEGTFNHGKGLGAPALPEIIISPYDAVIPLKEATPETCGSKAHAARRLAELGGKGSAFLTAPGCVVPFGVMEASLESVPELQKEYAFLVSSLGDPREEGFDTAVERLRAIIGQLGVPDGVISEIRKFKFHGRLMVRSSSNVEDLEGMSGAGLYESEANVSSADAAEAIQKVWSSLWSRRAALSRAILGIPHEKTHMAVLIQQMIYPDYSFIIHTENPFNRNSDETYIEVAAGLGETLASGGIAGVPYRIIYDRRSQEVRILSFASLIQAIIPGKTGGTTKHIVDYTQVRLSTDHNYRDHLALRLGEIGKSIEESFGRPQDIEGVVAGDDVYIVQSRPQHTGRAGDGGVSSCRTLGLLQKRIDGDDALLELARLRFRQAGLGAEFYADAPAELERLLGFSPSDDLPVVLHMPRGLDLFRNDDRERVLSFLELSKGRIYGMVLHDQNEMAERHGEYGALLRSLHEKVKGRGCYLFIEYAAGLDPDSFAGLFEGISDLPLISCCIDTGHIGLHLAKNSYARLKQGTDIFSVTAGDSSLDLLIDDMQAAVESAIGGVLSLIGRIGAIGKPVHFHLHDGHPLARRAPFGISDHLSFLEKIPVPFSFRGEEMLSPMFGPEGLSRIVKEALKIGGEKVSFTIEVHPAGGRLPLGDADHLFSHWKDKGNAERMNHWLSVIAANGRLVQLECSKAVSNKQ